MTDDPEALLAASVEQWYGLIREGRVGRVLKSIDSLPSSMDPEKPFLRIQVLHRARLHGQVLEEIEALTVDEDTDQRALLKLARMSADAGAGLLASRFLALAAQRSDTSDDLEHALATAVAIGNRELEQQIAERLRQVLPGSAVLSKTLVRDFVVAGNYGAAAAALTDDSAAIYTRELLTFLEEALRDDDAPDYRTISRRLSDLKPSWESRGHEELVRDAIRRGCLFDAVALVTGGTRDGPDIVMDGEIVLDVVEAALLAGEHNVAVSDGLQAAVVQVVRYLAERPADSSARLRLTRLLSPDMSGTLGVPIIASAALDLLHSAPVRTLTAPNVGMSAADLLARRAFLDTAFEWLQSEAPIVLGRSVLPAALLTEDPDDVAAGLMDAIVGLTHSINDESDVTSLLTWLSLAASVAPHTSQPEQDLVMMRLCAGALARAGRVQRARDLAENALYAAGTDPVRRRIAWSVMADAYHRASNNLESLIALACAAAHRESVDAREMWHESDCLVRILRDLGLHDLARKELGKAEELLRRMGWWESNQHRHRFMELQVEMSQLLREPSPAPEALTKLVADLAANAEQALARNDDPTAIAAMLGQAMRVAAESGAQLPQQAHSALELLLERTDHATASLVRAISSERLTKEDLLQLHQRTGTARYADDVGYDARHAAIAARRFLDGDDAQHDPYAVALAIELLADRAVPPPGWEITAKPSDSITDPDGPGRLAEDISTRGISVLLGALDRAGLLVSVTASDGRLGRVHRENPETFSAEALQDWGQQFPRRYGLDDTTPNLFLVSTERLRVSELPQSRLVLVVDHELQQIPPNLLRVEDQFAGSVQPTAAAPSLSWLSAAQNPGRLSRRRVAWISTEEQRGSTLAMLAERLSPTLAEYEIELDVGGGVPTGFGGSDLAIIAAHGGLAPEGRFFHRVSDEGVLTLAGSDVARSLRNVGVVILFVCSGGRADPHPSANTTIGLVRQILHHGGAAAIASPWPLDARVAYHWLPVFMASWRAGAPLIDANFEANRAVAQAFGHDPAKSLAMNVYGDPLRRFSA